MRLLGIREADVSNERLGKLIRNAEKDKIPVMAVVGAEVESNGLSIRTSFWRTGNDACNRSIGENGTSDR